MCAPSAPSPPPPPPPPQQPDPALEAGERARLRRKRGRASTILTGDVASLGDPGAGDRTTLLGG